MALHFFSKESSIFCSTVCSLQLSPRSSSLYHHRHQDLVEHGIKKELTNSWRERVHIVGRSAEYVQLVVRESCPAHERTHIVFPLALSMVGLKKSSGGSETSELF